MSPPLTITNLPDFGNSVVPQEEDWLTFIRDTIIHTGFRLHSLSTSAFSPLLPRKTIFNNYASIRTCHFSRIATAFIQYSHNHNRYGFERIPFISYWLTLGSAHGGRILII